MPGIARDQVFSIDFETQRILWFKKLPAVWEKLFGWRPHQSATQRWRIRGVRGIRIPTIVVAGRVFTSVEAIRWWVEATSNTAPKLNAEASAAPAKSADKALLSEAGILGSQGPQSGSIARG
jgi:hypothetical protein